jgi:hypothetical protein
VGAYSKDLITLKKKSPIAVLTNIKTTAEKNPQ